VAVGRRDYLQVFGNDYPTTDGTGIRDYIHVMDLAEGHVAALKALASEKGKGLHAWNLGTGIGFSVLDVVHAFEAASGKNVPYKIMPRRPGDISKTYADPTKAQAELGWMANRNLHQMMRDAWRWQSQNPQGYATPDSMA
jgi:UDP-glucose 4-epimerase